MQKIRGKDNRETKVTVRFTTAEMDRIKTMLQERNRGYTGQEGGEQGRTGSGGGSCSGEISLSEFVREKILILNRSLELRKIRLELTEINTRLRQVEMYLSRRGSTAAAAFTEEVFTDIQTRIKSILLKLEEESDNGSYSAEEY